MKQRLITISMVLTLFLSTIFPGRVLAEEMVDQKSTEKSGSNLKIVSINMEQNERTITPKEQIKINVEVSEGETDSEKLESIQVQLSCEQKLEPRTLTLNSECYNEDEGRYELTVPVLEQPESFENTREETWYISSVMVRSRTGEEVFLEEKDLQKEDGNGHSAHKYWYIVTNDSVVIESQLQTQQIEENTNDQQKDVEQVEKETNSQGNSTGKCKVSIIYYSIDKETLLQREKTVQYMDSGLKIRDVVAEAKKRGGPENGYPGLEFSEWEWNMYGQEEDAQISNNTTIYMNAEYDKIMAKCYYSYVDIKGELVEENRIDIVDKNMTMKEVEEMLQNYKLPESDYTGEPFDSWTLTRSGLPANDKIEKYADAGIYSDSASLNYNKDTGDKGIVFAEYIMLNAQGESKIVNKRITADINATYNNVVDLCKSNAPGAEYKDRKRNGWSTDSYIDGTQSFFTYGSSGWITLKEDYEGCGWVTYTYHSVNSEGDSEWINQEKLYPYGTEKSQIILGGKNTSLKMEYKNFKFTGWECNDIERLPETLNAKDSYDVSFEPLADNCLVQYYLFADSPWGKGSDIVHAFVVEKGTRIVPPANIGKHKNIEWWEPNKVVVKTAITEFYGEENVFDHTKVNTDTADPETTIYLPQNMQDTVIKQIESATEGSTIEVQLNDATILSKQILETMAGKNVNVEFVMENGAIWSVNGKSIQKGSLKDTNLLVQKYDKDKGPIPVTTMNKTAGELSADQLDLVHDGALGFDAQLILDADASFNGKKGILLWHNNGTMQLEDSAIVKESKLSFDFIHGSEYAVIYAVNGDVDSDGKISIRDMMRILHHISSHNPMNALGQGIADVDMNNKVNIQDLMKILHQVSGSSSGL